MAFVQQLLLALAPSLLTIATPILIYFVHRWIKVLEKKTQIDLTDEQERLIDKWISSGVAYANEQMRKSVDKGDTKLTGTEAREAAIKHAVAGLEASGITGVTAEIIEQMIEAKVNDERDYEDKKSPKISGEY